MIADDLAVLARPVDGLELLDGNPRRGDVDAVAASLARFGQRKPIVARRDGTVIAGNHTLQAARKLGWDHIAVVYVDDDDSTAKAFALADNRTAELGTYDEAALAELISDVRDADADLLAATGWDTDSVLELLERVEAAAGGSTRRDPDHVPSSAPSKTVEGDVWLLGPHRLVCGDVALVARQIRNSTRGGDTVLDLFGGSGSTLIAAHTTERVARLVELDPKFCDVICRRYQDITGIIPIAESTGRAHDFSGDGSP